MLQLIVHLLIDGVQDLRSIQHDARDAALAYLAFCAAVPIVGVAAYQLDGFFLGATQGRAMRNAAIFVTLAYVGLDLLLRPAFGNTGVWLAFLGMYVLRAGALAWYLPSLMRATANPPQPLQQPS